MRCIFCRAEETKVLDSRPTPGGDGIRRRRECLECGRRFSTIERVERNLPKVIKKDGRREEFDRGKILAGLTKACEKRPVSVEQLDRVVSEIESEATEMADGEVASKVIGELVMRKLKRLDKVAYVRFASVYREFKDVSEFLLELEPLIKAAKRARKGEEGGKGKVRKKKGR